MQAFLHARDCLDKPLSQRQLSTGFKMHRTRVAELVGSRLAEANGHPVGDGQDDATS